jgi:nucleotide-binding universal stress UspA family protein
MASKKGAALKEKYDGRREGWKVMEVKSNETAGKTLVTVCEKYKADLLVMGQSSSFLDRLLLGSNCVYAMRHAPCPVLVAKPQ